MPSDDLLARLRTQHESFSRILEGVSPELIRKRPASGKWSAHENLAHLARHHEVFLERIERILSEEKPQLLRYAAGADPEWPAWSERSTAEALERLHFLRGKIVALVEALSPDELLRVGVHPLLGEMTIPQWVEFFLLHEGHHLYTAMIRAHGG